MLPEYLNRIQKLNPSQINEVNLWVDNSIGDREIEENTFKSLNTLLLDKESEELFAYRNSYTRWLATYGWHLYQSLLFEQTVPLVLRHVFIGFLLGENVWDTIVTYLNNRSIDQEDMEKKYAKLREAFLKSQEIIYVDPTSGINYTIERFVNDSNLPQIAEDTLLQSDFFSKFQEKIKQRITEGGYAVDAFQVTGRLRDLTNFFVGIRTDRIWYVIDPYFYPQKYTFLDKVQSEESDITDFTQKMVANDEELLNSVAEDAEESLLEVPEKLTYIQIFEMVREKTDSLSEDERDEKIIDELTVLAEENNDEIIKDLYYYDEESGKFVWNQELLNQA